MKTFGISSTVTGLITSVPFEGDDVSSIIAICLTGKDINYKRSSVKISGNKDSMEIAIKADDPRALLASANSVLKQLRIISEVDSLLDKGISNV